MTIRRRTIAVALLVALATAVTAPAALAAAVDRKNPKGPRVVIDDTCSIIWPKRVESALGGPVSILAGSSFIGSAGCAASVGTDPTVAPGGTLQVALEYPTLLTSLANARAVVEDRRANEALSEHALSDVDGVGKSAYFNATQGTITVLATKKFAFTLGWARVGDPEISTADQTALISLAKNTVRRLKR